MENSVLLSGKIKSDITATEILVTYRKKIDYLRDTDPLLYCSLCKESGLKYLETNGYFILSTDYQYDHIFQILYNKKNIITEINFVYKSKLTESEWIKLVYKWFYERVISHDQYFIDFKLTNKSMYTEFDTFIQKEFNDKIVVAQDALIELFNITNIFGVNFKTRFLNQITKDLTI